ncbi:hypothetical protein DRO48_01195 [Candidatus Bathyarchaeota archaeon]|nr:MAG: hypothetical protein DRO48_01195 [Candidatus Bathyarchaeota archaeon]
MVGGSVAVIGAGVAGLCASLALAKLGVKVYLIEKQPKLGGLTPQLSRVFPTLRDAKELINPLIEACRNHPNITILTEAEVRSVEGSLGDFTLHVSEASQSGGQTEKTLKASAIIVATGLRPIDAGIVKEYGYGRNKNVITALELERMLSSDGRVVRPSDGESPKCVVFVQCVGSRSLRSSEKPYCSKVCCMTAVKQAYELKKSLPDAEVYVLYTDLRAYGRGWQELADEAKACGVRFVRARPSEILEDPETGELTLWYEDTETREMVELKADLAVLNVASTACWPSLGDVLGVDVDEHGFVRPPNPLASPVDTSRPGVYAAGGCLGPADIGEAVIQAYAAVARASEALALNIGDGRSILVVGAGVAGMTAALALARQAFNVYLVEKEGEIGGLLRRLDRLYPTGEKAEQLLNWLAEQVKSEGKIRLYTSATVKKAERTSRGFLVEISAKTGEETLEVDAIVVAIGAQPYQPLGECGYGELEGVITQIELEERLKEDRLGTPRTVVMIQCVGARTPERPYCGKICCITALKNAIQLKQKSPSTEVYVLYEDIQAYGVDGEAHYRLAQSLGVRFIRFAEANPPRLLYVEGRKVLRVEDSLLGREITLSPDLVVLSTPLTPTEAAAGLASLLGVQLAPDGFMRVTDTKLMPVDTPVDGVYVCGTASGPATVQEAVAQAYAVAGRIASKLASQ